MLGVTSGIWVFAAHAPGQLPQVLLLPVQFTQKNPASAAGGQIPWEVSFELVPAEPGSALERAALAAVAADRPGVEAALPAVAETGDAAALVAAGEIALMVRAPALAGALFERAVAKEPTLGRAHLGLASAAMMNGAWDVAAKRLWTARDLGLPERLIAGGGGGDYRTAAHHAHRRRRALTGTTGVSAPRAARAAPGR